MQEKLGKPPEFSALQLSSSPVSPMSARLSRIGLTLAEDAIKVARGHEGLRARREVEFSRDESNVSCHLCSQSMGIGLRR